jgi:hypothetical protein
MVLEDARTNGVSLALYFAEKDFEGAELVQIQERIAASFADAGSSKCLSIRVNSIAIIVDIEDIKENFRDCIQCALDGLPVDLIPDAIAYDANPDSAPDEAGLLHFHPCWSSNKATTIQAPQELLIMVDTRPTISSAVQCIARTKSGHMCKNKTRDATGRCWRHRDCLERVSA